MGEKPADRRQRASGDDCRRAGGDRQCAAGGPPAGLPRLPPARERTPLEPHLTRLFANGSLAPGYDPPDLSPNHAAPAPRRQTDSPSD